MPDLEHGDGLLLVDVQRDFCPGGALAIEDGDAVVPVVNRWIERATRAGAPIYASRDWHPHTHLSFVPYGGLWPPHCIQDTPGARFHEALQLPADARIVTKGTRFDKDQYSAFDETGLETALRREGVTRLWIGGLAQDVCVRATALDALTCGFAVHVIVAATRPVTRAAGIRAVDEMRAAGATICAEA